ncbi:hypothetical protein PRUG_00019 [Prochlorococcus phage P-SSP6]|uniref:Gp165 n=2 Tax=Tangaroavirus tv951510a TaxID=2733962 RepID=M1NXF9_9CAUD|nr:gp165 [Cyanophage 9515-10a]ADP00046.1 gp165 [Cyanophage 9515-10a]AGF91576.1 hypothetical protein PRUG_00019 [Prochlorococcus phage P-SSP6]
MDFNPVTAITSCCQSRFTNSQFHTREYEQHNYNDPRNYRRNYYYNLWVSFKQMDWRKYNSYISNFWRNSRFRFSIYNPYSWRSLRVRSSNQSCKSGTIRNRNRKRNRHYFYYGIIISLFSIAPARAEETAVSNPVAAATGNVTNQAVQFQNNGAPSRQHYGPNISCNGATMTFSPFYMGNHTKPWDIDESGMRPSSYTLGENWGGQLNFMIPLDREGLKRCRSMAARQEEKMRLDYELVRVKNCAELQQKGFMLKPGSRVGEMCSDVIPIAQWEKDYKLAVKNKLENECKPIPKGWKQWQKQKYQCPTTQKKQ